MIGTFFNCSGTQVETAHIELKESLDDSILEAIKLYRGAKLVIKSRAWAVVSLKVQVENKKGKSQNVSVRLLISE